MKGRWWILVVVVAVVGIVLWGYPGLLRRDTAVAASNGQVTELVTVARGMLIDSIDGSGSLVPSQEMALSFENPGRVVEVLVEVDDSVSEGELLARLDTSSLEFNVARAEVALEQAQVQLAQVQAPPTDAEIARAEAQLRTARANYAKLLSGPPAAQLAQLQANLELAEKRVQQAQGNYDRYGSRMAPALQDATIAYDKARLAYEIALEGANQSSLISARSQVEQAQAALDDLLAGPDPDDVEAAELRVQQAQLSLEQARRNLENATLLAPFDGVITAVRVGEGEIASAGPAFSIADLATLEVEFFLDEADITQVTVGHPVRVTAEAVSGESAFGEVTAIAPTAQIQSGVPLFPVTVQLSQIPEQVRPGMTVDVEVITEVWEDVLYLPQRAVLLDGDRAYVMVQMADGELVEQPVQLGRSLSGNVEILDGVAEGAVVAVITEIATGPENPYDWMQNSGFPDNGRP